NGAGDGVVLRRDRTGQRRRRRDGRWDRRPDRRARELLRACRDAARRGAADGANRFRCRARGGGGGAAAARADPALADGPAARCLATSAIPSVIDSFLLQIPLFLIAGVSRGLLRVTGSADAFEGAGEDERRHGVTAALLYGGLDLGKIAGPVIGGVVAGAFGI